MASIIQSLPPPYPKPAMHFVSTHCKKSVFYEKPPSIFTHRLLDDDEDGLSIKSGGTISSGGDSAMDSVSDGYEEIKEILMINKAAKEKTVWSGSDTDWTKRNMIQATVVQQNNTNNNRYGPYEKSSSFLKISKLNSQTNSITSNDKSSPQYQHFNNWKLHLLTYKQNKGYLTRKRPDEPLSVQRVAPNQTPAVTNIIDETYTIPNNSLNSFNIQSVSSLVASANNFDAKKFTATSSTNSGFITKPSIVNFEDRLKHAQYLKDKSLASDLLYYEPPPYRPPLQHKQPNYLKSRNGTQEPLPMKAQQSINSFNVNLQITIDKVSQTNAVTNLQALRECNRKEKNLLNLNSNTNQMAAPSFIQKLPSIREQHKQRIKKQNSKENIFKQFEKLPSMKSYFSSKKAEAIKHESKNASVALLKKVNAFARKQQGVTKPGIMPLPVEATNLQQQQKPPTKPVDPHLKVINEYHEITKALSNKRKRTFNVPATTNTLEPSEEDFEFVKKHATEDRNLNNVFQVLRKDQRRILAFYHRVNENETLHFPSYVSISDRMNHLAPSNMKQKVYI